jgi:WD40 repeat protein/energy-coupling factor transporter ATP-binding protein EcfA2
MPDKKIDVRQRVSGTGHIFSGTGNVTVGYNAEQVSALLERVGRTYQPKAFDGRSPYVGLSAFEEEDADHFFGREKAIEELTARVQRSRFIVVAGPSGSGKSSLVRAGLIDALKKRSLPGSDRWLYSTLKPGRQPLEQLAWAMSRLAMPGGAGSAEAGDYFRRSDDGNAIHKVIESRLSDRADQRALIFCDQFEEIFTQVSKEEERLSFLDLLTRAPTYEGGRVIMIVALRSDFVSNCAEYPSLNDLLNSGFFQLGAMAPEDLVKAIALPAQQVGLKIDPDLIAQIINDMKGEPGALPLTQFALNDMFDAGQKAGGVIALTLADYLARGGIRKSLERHADAEFAKLSPEEKELARGVFTGLIQVGHGAQATRRTALMEEIRPPGAFERDFETVIDKLAKARLITAGQEEGNARVVTVSHEKLIDAWPWLHRLVDENRDAILVQNQIVEDAQEWESNRRDASYLYTGARLATAREKLVEKKLRLGALAQMFLAAGIDAEEDRRTQEEARRRKELEDARMLADERRRRLTETNRLRYISIAQALAAQAPRQMEEFGQHERAALLSRQAYLFHDGNAGTVLDQIDESLRVILTRRYFALTLTMPSQSKGNSVHCLAYSPDGRQLAIGCFPSLYLVPATAPGEWRTVFQSERGVVTAVAFSPHGELLAWGTWEGKVYLHHLDDREGGVVELGDHDGRVRSVAFSHDGRTLASGGGNYVCIWSPSAPGRPFAKLKSLDDEVGEVSSVAFSPDDKLLVSSASDHKIRLWDRRRRRQRPRFLQGTRIWAQSVAFASNSLLAAAGDAGIVELWNLATDPPRMGQFSAPVSVAGSVAFSPDGRLIAVAGMRDEIHLYDLTDSEMKPAVLRGHANSITQVAFAPDGSRLASSSNDGTVRLWDLMVPKAETVVRPVPQQGWSIECVASHGNRIAVSYNHGVVQLFDAADPSRTLAELRGDVLGPVRGALPIDAVAFVPGRNVLVTGHSASATWLWDLDEDPPRPVPMKGVEGWIGAVAVSKDGRLIASGGGDGQLRLWQASNTAAEPRAVRLLPETDRAERGINALAFHPTTDVLAVVGKGEVFLLHLDRLDEKPQLLAGNAAPVSALAFSPDGRYLATGSVDQKARLFELDTAQALEFVHEGKVQCVAFSPDGLWLATGSTDGAIRLWDVRHPGNSAVVLRGHKGMISSLAFTTQGTRLVSGGWDGTVRVWIPWTSSLADMVCSKVWRNLSQSEWHRFIGEDIAYEATCSSLPADLPACGR